jgi:hypothetical protein
LRIIFRIMGDYFYELRIILRIMGDYFWNDANRVPFIRIFFEKRSRMLL